MEFYRPARCGHVSIQTGGRAGVDVSRQAVDELSCSSVGGAAGAEGASSWESTTSFVRCCSAGLTWRCFVQLGRHVTTRARLMLVISCRCSACNT